MNDTKKPHLHFPASLLPLLSDKENSVLCPYGIAAVLAMVSEGASEDCLDEILSTLGFDRLDELRASLKSVSANPCDAFKSKNTIMLITGKQRAALLDRFTQTMRDQYSAVVYENASDGDPSVHLQNVADFKAEWLYRMERDTGRDRRFQNADGSICRPAFLNCTNRLRYYIGTAVQAVALPYKLHDKAIPFELVLIDSQKPLPDALLKEILLNMQEGKCEVAFPEFSVKSNFDLIPMMNRLGLVNIFDKECKAFDRVATIPLYAESFGQKAEIQVDKRGTVAKAITFMEITAATSCIPERRIKLLFDRPFHYFLCDTNTGEILFMGKVNRLED